MTTSVATLKEAINEVRYNPAAIQRKVFDTLEAMNQGTIDVVDPSNPFVFLLEASSVLTSAQMEEAENLTRQQYPSMAQTEAELYLHMSDKDYIGRFATPSYTTFTVLFNKDELIQRAVSAGESGVRQLTLPRNTEFQVSDYVFTMEYPIDIRVMPHGGLQVVYDASQPSPLQNLPSNVVNWDVVKLKGDDYVRLQIPVYQCKVTPKYAHLNKSTNYLKQFPFEDRYYHCRAYRLQGESWVEIRTTHSDQVFDPSNPTVVLNVTQGMLSVSVPQIYISNGLLSGELRFDIYTTKGPIDAILDSYEINAFSVNWRDIANESSVFSAPLDVFSSMAVYSDAVISGGSEGLDFETLRDRVLMNALGNAQLPITASQLTARLASMGYRAIKDVDNVTNRIYLASRRLPSPASGNTVGAAAAMIGTVQSTQEALSYYQGIVANGNRTTVTSDALFYRDNGVLRLVPNNVRNELEGLTGSALVNRVNESRYLMSPFHYVLDGTKDYFSVRAYYLDAPEIEQREFVEENLSLGLELASDAVSVIKHEKGYVLQVRTRSGERVQAMSDEAVSAQLSYRPPNEKRDVYLKGVLVERLDGERVFEFALDTQFDVTDQHHLMLDSLSMYQNEIKSYRAELTTRFDLVYLVDNLQLDIDRRPLNYTGGNFLHERAVTGVSWERLSVTFGSWLEGFWESGRTVPSEQAYLRYEQDVFATHNENVYRRDPITGTIDVQLGENGEIVYDLIHRKGDPVLDKEGEPVIEHYKGEVVADESGEPVVADSRKLLREWDLFLLDARYRFATRLSDQSYLEEVPRTLVGWLEQDLTEFRQWSLEQTDIYLYPIRTMGSAEVTVGEGESRRVELEQAFTVTLYQTRDKYDDPFVRETLTQTVKEVLRDALEYSQITVNGMVSQLSARMGEDAIACDIKGLGGEMSLLALTLKNEFERCSIRKRLEGTMDGGYEVVDDIDIVFVRHQNEA